jgi:hypothetical protein
MPPMTSDRNAPRQQPSQKRGHGTGDVLPLNLRVMPWLGAALALMVGVVASILLSNLAEALVAAVAAFILGVILTRLLGPRRKAYTFDRVAEQLFAKRS